jgi:5-methylcytosine-specific restriction endonuclease McrA
LHRPNRDLRVYKAAYYQRTKERDRVKRQLVVVNRRARIRVAGGSFSLTEWLEKIALFAGCCIYCGEREDLTVDHNMPISRGGTNDIANILPACLSCNQQKGRRTAREFIAARMAN